MKFVENIKELKKGDTIIIKDNDFFSEKGFPTVRGEVFSLDKDEEHVSIKCHETNSIDMISLNDGKIFLIS